MDQAAKLRELISRPDLTVAPGCYDGFSAKLVEQAGFEVAYMTGFGTSASVLGLPDTGLISFSEMAANAANLAAAIDIPLIADADTGYGNAVNVYHTVRTYARNGVAGLHIEDQVSPKKCGHVQGKQVIPIPEMVGKIKAACEARAEKDIVIIVRTDARAVNGFEDTMERCHAFEEAGADMIFFEAPETEEEMRQVASTFKVPTMINIVQNGITPCLPAPELEALGYSLAIYPALLMRVAVRAMRDELARFGKERTLVEDGSGVGFDEIKALVGFPWYYEMEGRYTPK